MRPVNLIPEDDRRGARTPTRRGGLGYAVLAVLALALAALVAVLVHNNTIADREAEVAQLQQDEVAARARLQKVQAFAEFAAVEERRAQTVTSLAQSRFDWERVIQELSRVTPSDIWLVNLTGSVSPAVQLEDSAGIGIRSQVAGPALELVGCGTSQDAVAGYIAALGEVDGVTRVSAAKSERPTARTNSAEGDAAPANENADCRTRDHIVRFEVVAAFDAVTVPPVTGQPPAAPAPAPDAGGADPGSLTDSATQAAEVTGGDAG